MELNEVEGIAFDVVEHREWKHSVLKFVAKVLYKEKTDYVILLRSTQDESSK